MISEAQDVTEEAFETLISTMPTAPEGLSSVRQFFQRHQGIGKSWRTVSRHLETFLDTLATAARRSAPESSIQRRFLIPRARHQ